MNSCYVRDLFAMHKTFDSVAMMRELRDRLSEEMAGISRAERIRHVRDIAAATPLGARLMKLAGETGETMESSNETKSQ